MAAVVSLEDARAARGRGRRREAEEERWRSKAEVAEFFAVHPKTVERWIRRGCPAERMYGDRGRWRLKLSAVQQWLGMGSSTG